MTPATRDVPKEIASAIVLVMQAMGKLTKSGVNEFGKYRHVTIDDVLAMTGPACAEAGLIVKPVLCAPVDRDMIDVYDKATKQMHKRRVARYTYKFRLIHASGAMWTDEDDVREVQLDDTGPQTLMAAESYALKGYLRTLLQIPTGDADADAQEQHQAEIIKATVKAAKAKLETGTEHVLIDFGSGLEAIPAADVTARVLAHVTSIGDAKAVAEWWDQNRHGREQFHNQFPKLALGLKRKIEEFLAALQAGPAGGDLFPAADDGQPTAVDVTPTNGRRSASRITT